MEKSKKYYLDLYDDLERIVETACEANECVTCPLRGKNVFDKYCIKGEVEVGFENLIKEYFDNPPLKFEELKERMWVWDNKNKLYVQIDYDFDDGNNAIIIRYHEDSHNSNVERVKFEENRFFRKEVKE